MQYRVMQNNRTQSNNSSGDYSFDPGFTRLDPLTASATTGYGYSSFLMGYAASGSVQKVERLALQSKYVSWFIQDDWRVNAKLTLNLGLRYSIEPFITERFNRLSRFDPNVIPTNAANYTGLPLQGGLVFMNDGNRSPSSTFKKQFAPRFGLAYTLTPKTVLRGGYGIFWLANNLSITNGNGNNPAYSVSTPFLSSIDGGLTPYDQLNNPLPNGILNPPGSAAGPDTLIGQGIGNYMDGIKPGYMQQWNFDIQRELPGGMALSVAYAGSKGTHLPGPDQQIDQLPVEFMALGSRLQQQVPNPFYGSVGIGPLAQPNVAYGQLLRPYPQYNGYAMKNPTNRNSIYHSAQINLEKRFARGGSIVGAYTWSKLISDTDTITGWLEPGGGAGNVQDHYNIRAERSLALYDTPHRLVVSYVYDLPFGKGQHWGSGVTGFTSKLVSGWGVNGISTFQSGNPLPISVANNTSNSFGGGQRPNRTGVGVGMDGSAQSRLGQWFNTGAFSLPAAFTFGNASRTMPDMRSHGIANYDFTIFKNTEITESVRLQFRTEIFNLFNRVRFGYPGTAQGNPQFGVISAQYNDPRLVQFALRLLF